MATLEGWKRLVMIVDSPVNGITCGVTREIGEDPVAVCRWFGERDHINHVHYRNVRVRRASVDYTEVFLDEGGYAGLVYNVAYTKAMLQAALSS